MATRKIPLSNDEKYSICAAAVLFALGYLISAYICPTILQRFGGLIICIGVLFGVKGLPDKVDVTTDIVKEELQEISSAIEDLFKNAIIDQETKSSLLRAHGATCDKIDLLNLRVKTRLLRIEGLVVVFGTIINSWGDLIVYSIYQSCE